MAKIKESAAELIGGTPLLRLNQYSQKVGATEATILAKLELLKWSFMRKNNPPTDIFDRKREHSFKSLPFVYF